jgi:TetR/AcrR family transcriptional regulator, repressor for neighboring sulfatase
MNARARKPRLSPDETRARLVAACVDVLETSGPAGVSVRDVAARAGVNHGMVHRYFKTKDALLAAAIAHLSAEAHRAGPDAALTASSFAYLRGHPELVQLVARACLDGPDELLAIAAPTPDRLEAIAARIRLALARAHLDRAVDAHLVNAFATAALLGWFTFQPLLRRGYGLPADADDRLAALLAMLDQLVAG